MYRSSEQIAEYVLTKIAKRREIREWGNLSPEDQQRIIENNKRIGMRHEREIRRLGEGSMSEGVLVSHPQHGLVVRKSTLTGANPVGLRQHPHIQIFDDIRQYQEQHGPSGMARVREVTPEGMVFQDYTPGKSVTQERDKKRTLDLIRRKYFTASTPEEKLRASRLYDKAEWRVRREIPWGERPAGLNKMYMALRSKYPKAFDFASPWNMIRTPQGLMSIDMSPSQSLPPIPTDAVYHPRAQFQLRAQQALPENMRRPVLPVTGPTTTTRIPQAAPAVPAATAVPGIRASRPVAATTNAWGKFRQGARLLQKVL